MQIKDKYSRKKRGLFTVNRRGMFHITSITMDLPFKKKLVIYKSGSGRGK